MKKSLTLLVFIIVFNGFSQEHFSGISLSKRTGILNTTVNPAELSNLSNSKELNLFGFSFNASNNKISINDLMTDDNFEDILFQGNKNVSISFDGEILGPSFALKINRWAFGIHSKAILKANVSEINSSIGDAITNNGSNIPLTTFILQGDNQRANATSYGEIGFTAARLLFENEKYKWNAGTTIKLLFPGSYANIGLQTFEGNITVIDENAYLNDATGELNIAYTENLGDSFTETSDYTKSVFGKLNGFGVDFGINFQIKDQDENDYKLNTGIAIKNIGSMNYKDNNGNHTNYSLNIQPTVANPLGLDLSLFDGSESLSEVQQILEDSGYLTETSTKRNFKVKLPTLLSLYADVKIISQLYCTVYFQQKLNDDLENDQVTSQNTISVTPRYLLKSFEVFAPISSNEISGFNTGLGFRIGGFYLGSGSAITALAKDAKQIDLYFGWRLGIGK
jgi:hypothetical protein